MINVFLNGVCVVTPIEWRAKEDMQSAQLMVGWSAFSGSSSFGVMSQTSCYACWHSLFSEAKPSLPATFKGGYVYTNLVD
jgi:hypothetical protein